jgi:excisionase family DNA binding protein
MESIYRDYADSVSTAWKGEDMAVEETNLQIQAGSEKRTYSVQEIADILQISRSMAYNLCRQSLFKTVKVGKYVRISKSSFDDWLDSKN